MKLALIVALSFFIGFSILTNPLHVSVGLVIFVVCTWAVFSHRVQDGFIGRHLLTFAAIAAAGFAYSGEVQAFLTSYALILVFMMWFMVQNLRKMSHAKMD